MGSQEFRLLDHTVYHRQSFTVLPRWTKAIDSASTHAIDFGPTEPITLIWSSHVLSGRGVCVIVLGNDEDKLHA